MPRTPDAWRMFASRSASRNVMWSSLSTRAASCAGSGIRRDELGQALTDRGDRLEGLATEQVVGELDVEGVLEREHQVDAGVRRQPGAVEVVAVRQRRDVDRQPAVLGYHFSNSFLHQCPSPWAPFSSARNSRASSGIAPPAPPAV